MFLAAFRSYLNNNPNVLTGMDRRLVEYFYEHTKIDLASNKTKNALFNRSPIELEELAKIYCALTALVLRNEQLNHCTVISTPTCLQSILDMLQSLSQTNQVLTHTDGAHSSLENFIFNEINIEDFELILEHSNLVETSETLEHVGKRPVVYFKHRNLLALQKNVYLEHQIANLLCSIKEHNTSNSSPTISSLHQQSLLELDESQQQACLSALQNRFSIICGGPGSGKTNLVFHIMFNLYIKNPHIKIALAAPTGKAAARLNASLQHHIKLLPEENQVLFHGYKSAQTIHRLLGFSDNPYQSQRSRPLIDSPSKPLSDQVNVGAQPVLAFDVLIIDEVSMLDFSLLKQLLSRTSDSCQLIFLGDPDQLPAIQHGNLIDAANKCALKDNLFTLSGQYRFDVQSNIAQLLNHIKSGQSDEATQLLEKPLDKSLSTLAESMKRQALWQHLEQQTDGFMDVMNHDQMSIEDKIDQIYRQMVLTPFVHGELGVNEINLRLMQYCSGRQNIAQHHIYHGLPIMINTNDYHNNLFNGDIGVILDDKNNGQLSAYFKNYLGQVERIAPTALPEFQSCYAMTIHKSQGSEFDQVTLVIERPNSEQQSALLTRELIYTAISRTRRQLHLCVDTPSFTSAVAKLLRHDYLLPSLIDNTQLDTQNNGTFNDVS